ncbi:MAG: ATP synthase F1 subunit delta [Saprospiraceae bacterium]|uniref:ATP synthase subunit delta n=1 Tax=Candidatus Opimibacter skivensis TaxID=2982028 RepID=A0A9D7SXG6_9BACT|nr:ATP synthase F1 subunit delta [Candidatus Opimibacter skivensis]
MSTYRIASRYAKSLLDLAIEQGKLDVVLKDVESFVKATENRDFALLLKSPLVKSDKKEKVLDEIFKGNMDKLTSSFLHIIIRKGREAQLAEIGHEFINQYRVIKNISIVNVVSAEPIGEETLSSIRKKLIESKMTRGNIEFKTSVDKDLIGGFVISFEDRLYDASVSHQLDLLRKQFTGKEYQVSF